MFRRREDALDSGEFQNDMLEMDDDAPIELTENDTQAQAEEVSPVAAPSPAASAATVKPTPAPAPAPAAAFRPQAPASVPANRNVPAAADVRSGNAVSAAPKASKRVLTVGHDIHMKGEITTCDRLVIEGSVDATLKDVHTMELAQSGSFKGVAEIEDAEISGAFEGDLICTGRLIIYSSGTVSGNVSYGEIEIERGGRLTGTVKTADQIKAESGSTRKAA